MTKLLPCHRGHSLGLAGTQVLPDSVKPSHLARRPDRGIVCNHLTRHDLAMSQLSIAIETIITLDNRVSIKGG
ncbi:MAG: hypothetical protein II040_02380 [Muribaculaceae bacterium]|nr:hypothetical protein [Muribaculaceae bacterium]